MRGREIGVGVRVSGCLCPGKDFGDGWTEIRLGRGKREGEKEIAAASAPAATN